MRKQRGVIATNDAHLYNKLQDLVHDEGSALDIIEKKVIALSLQNKKHIEAQVSRRMAWVQLVANALKKHNIPVVQPVAGHCILLDVKQVPEFRGFKYPVASFVAWMFLNTGIRSAAHNAGMQKNTAINDLVRIAIPLGYKQEQIEEMIRRLILLFERKENIPELVMDGNISESFGDIYREVSFKKYHNVSQRVVPKTDTYNASPTNNIGTIKTPVPGSGTASKETRPSQEAISTRRPHQPQDIAIVGMSGRYPKAKNLNDLWDNLVQGRDCID
ncbi:MAG: hypothetical protein HC896_18585, partial [Bacteroidales bacterium]|nr:hypothetical protein [Bacteroidales bacterium]